MQKHQVRSPEQALAYITDCTLATVAEMAMKKSRLKFDFKRQIAIAQTAIDWMNEMKIDMTGTRADSIAHHTNGVEEWAKKFMPEHKTAA